MNFLRTCLIVGAGGSVPYGLPTGAQLRDLVVMDRSDHSATVASKFPVRDLNNAYFDARDLQEAGAAKAQRKAVTAWKRFIGERLLEAGYDGNNVSAFRAHFFESRSPSIDRFIQFNADEWGAIGRAYIAAVILNCERASMLDKDWYLELLDQIASHPSSFPPANALSILTFNYDRSFEMFFRTSFRRQFSLSEEEADALYQRIRIEHVYGSFGSLDVIPYGNTSSIRQAAEGIDFMRNSAQHARRHQINTMIGEASVVCFLGFSFAPENLALFAEQGFQRKVRVLATSLGLSQRRMAEVKRFIPSIEFHDLSAAELLRQEDVFGQPAPSIEPEQARRPIVQFEAVHVRRNPDRDFSGL